MRPRHWPALLLLLAAACSAGSLSQPETSAEERAVSIATTACGHASKTTGTGVVIESGVVVTAAHVVAGANEIRVGPDSLPARLIRLDLGRDLAALSVETAPVEAVRFATLAAGDLAIVVGGSNSGSIEVVVERPVVIDVDDVRGSERHDRGGYVLAGRIAPGDSGAGLFDGDALVGIVFAVPSDGREITYAVDAVEIQEFMADGGDSAYSCDPENSRVVETELD